MTTKIRRATAKDVPAWGAMRTELWPDHDAAVLTRELVPLLKRDRFRGWLAVEGGAPIGFAEASVRDFANGCDTKPVAFLEGIWVRADRRRRGVGGRLVAAVEAWARARGLRELGSDTWLDDRRSQRSHRGWGFEETERVVYFRKRLRLG